MADPDWKDIPLSRQAEVRRRVAILDDYIALERPTENDRQEAMQRLGVKRASFYRLVRAWKEQRDPARLPGAIARKDGKGRGAKLDPRMEAIIRQAIANAGAASPPKVIEAEVGKLCDAAGLTHPSSAPVARLRREALFREGSQQKPIIEEPSVVIESCAIDLPTLHDDREVLPVVTAAFLQPEGTIAGYAIDYTAPNAMTAVRMLLEIIDPEGPARTLVMRPPDTPLWNILSNAVTAAGVSSSDKLDLERGTVFDRLAGSTLGGLPLAIRSTKDPSAPGRARYADPAQTAEVIREAIEIHNQARTGAPDPSDALAHQHEKSRFSLGDATERFISVLRWMLAMPGIHHQAESP